MQSLHRAVKRTTIGGLIPLVIDWLFKDEEPKLMLNLDAYYLIVYILNMLLIHVFTS